MGLRSGPDWAVRSSLSCLRGRSSTVEPGFCIPVMGVRFASTPLHASDALAVVPRAGQWTDLVSRLSQVRFLSAAPIDGGHGPITSVMTTDTETPSAETSPIVPDWDDIPEDDNAEPKDADIDHSASVEDVERAVEQ